jgi:hypothetical protein
VADQVLVDNGGNPDFTVSTDDAGASGHVQRMKLAYSADGIATHVTADASGLLVQTAATVQALASGTAISTVLLDSTGDVLSLTQPGELTAGPTIYSAGAVAQYDSLHTTVMTLSGAANANGGTGRILGARLVNKHNTYTGTVAAHVFRKSVTGTTGGDTLAVSDTDKLEQVGTLTFDFSLFPPLGGGRVATASRTVLPMDYKCDAGTDDLFMILQHVTSDTPTFAASDLVPFVSFIAD